MYKSAQFVLLVWLLFHVDPINGKEYFLTVPLNNIDCQLLKDQYQEIAPDTKYMCINLDGDSTAVSIIYVPTMDSLFRDIVRSKGIKK